MASWPLSPVIWRGVGPLNPTRSASLVVIPTGCGTADAPCRIFDGSGQAARRSPRASVRDKWMGGVDHGVVALGNSEHRGQGRLCEGKLLPVESGRVDTTFIIEGEHSKGAADNAPRTAIGRLTTKSAMRSRVARSGGFHGGKVQDRVVGDSTAVGVTELRARRSGVAHGRIAPGVQAATIQPWPKTFRPSSLTAVFAMRPNRLARRFSAPATRALASSAGSTGSRGSFSRNASLAAQRWSALQPVTPWSDGTI